MAWTAARNDVERPERYAAPRELRPANEFDEALVRPRGRAAWSPALGAPAADPQRPPPPPALLADGTVVGELWASSEGPCRVDPGGAGGSPDGRSVPIRKVVWD